MSGALLGWRRVVCLIVLAALPVCLGLGSSTRLTYHEAFVAQGAQEILESGRWWYPTIGGLPWLEKPPLPFWLAAGCGWLTGGVTPMAARLPSALAALGLVLGVALLAARHYGGSIGVLAGAVQATTAWTVLRGRLAEADMLLACLVTWTLLAFDRIRVSVSPQSQNQVSCDGPRRWDLWRWAFFGLLSITSLVKGTGFGAALILSVVAAVLIWDRDRATWRRFWIPAGWILVALLALAWPLAMVVEHGFKVIGLWAMHVAQRVGPQAGHGPFAGESWREYWLNVFGQALPWAPLALVGASRSLGRALGGRGHGYVHHRGNSTAGASRLDLCAGDRLLWAWAIVPLVLVTLASARNAHYAIYALVPWSVWGALGLARLGTRLVGRGCSPGRLRQWAVGGFAALGLAYSLGFWLLGPRLERRGVEWAFYQAVGRQLPSGQPIVLLYDDWDRDPYPTPFGPIPHDLAIRLYYLNRPACWHFKPEELADHRSGRCPQSTLRGSDDSLVIIGRERDLPALEHLGRAEVLAQGPSIRWDRTYLLARFWPGSETASRPPSSVRSLLR
jgi:4-amino-4-deoxy-L-arabinose transferase-like glycosyltransferase